MIKTKEMEYRKIKDEVFYNCVVLGGISYRISVTERFISVIIINSVAFDASL